MTTPRRTRMTIDEVFAVLETAAVKGERCPVSQWQENAGPPPSDLISSSSVTALARQGRILVEVSGRCWRTVTILTGPHAGKKTMPDPRGGAVWQTIGLTTTKRTHADERAARPGPSAPRDFSRRAIP